MHRGAGLRPEKWIALAVFAVGIAALLFAAAPRPDQGLFGVGLLYTVLRYDQSLPLIGLGLAIAQTRRRLLMLSLAMFAAGVPLGSVAASFIDAALAAGVGLIRYLFLLGPACSMITGVSLVLPRSVRAWVLPLAALLVGAVLGLVVDTNNPTVEERAFMSGAVLSGVWLVAAPLLLWRRFARPWFEIAGRIFGSWLVAIGVMVGALHLIPPREAPAPPPAETAPPSDARRAEPSDIAPPTTDRSPGLPDQTY